MWEYKEKAKARQSNKNLQGLTHQDTELPYKRGDNICKSEKPAAEMLISFCAENIEVSATHCETTQGHNIWRSDVTFRPV